jgi:hypothetical protein
MNLNSFRVAKDIILKKKSIKIEKKKIFQIFFFFFFLNTFHKRFYNIICFLAKSTFG